MGRLWTTGYNDRGTVHSCSFCLSWSRPMTYRVDGRPTRASATPSSATSILPLWSASMDLNVSQIGRSRSSTPFGSGSSQAALFDLRRNSVHGFRQLLPWPLGCCCCCCCCCCRCCPFPLQLGADGDVDVDASSATDGGCRCCLRSCCSCFKAACCTLPGWCWCWCSACFASSRSDCSA